MSNKFMLALAFVAILMGGVGIINSKSDDGVAVKDEPIVEHNKIISVARAVRDISTEAAITRDDYVIDSLSVPESMIDPRDVAGANFVGLWLKRPLKKGENIVLSNVEKVSGLKQLAMKIPKNKYMFIIKLKPEDYATFSTVSVGEHVTLYLRAAEYINDAAMISQPTREQSTLGKYDFLPNVNLKKIIGPLPIFAITTTNPKNAEPQNRNRNESAEETNIPITSSLRISNAKNNDGREDADNVFIVLAVDQKTLATLRIAEASGDIVYIPVKNKDLYKKLDEINNFGTSDLLPEHKSIRQLRG